MTARPRPGGDAELPPHLARVYLLRSVEDLLRAESERLTSLETGGVVVGFHDASLDAVVVTAASGPGPRARHGSRTFNRDRAFCQAFLDDHARASGGTIDFVGEWHKHPEPDPWPSAVDTDTYTRLAADPHASVDRPLVLITGTRAVWAAPRPVLGALGGDGAADRRAPTHDRSVERARATRVSGPPRDVGRRDVYVGVNAFAFRTDGFLPREVRWLTDEAYEDLQTRLSSAAMEPAYLDSPGVPDTSRE